MENVHVYGSTNHGSGRMPVEQTRRPASPRVVAGTRGRGRLGGTGGVSGAKQSPAGLGGAGGVGGAGYEATGEDFDSFASP